MGAAASLSEQALEIDLSPSEIREMVQDSEKMRTELSDLRVKYKVLLREREEDLAGDSHEEEEPENKLTGMGKSKRSLMLSSGTHWKICGRNDPNSFFRPVEGSISGTISLLASDEQENLAGAPECQIELPRGGVYLKTKYGPVQFGIPPETIKDSMRMGLEVPKHFVIPEEKFHLQLGVNVGEVEFPAYFNFFMLKSKVNIICGAEIVDGVNASFSETLEGPDKQHLFEDQEFGKFATKQAFDSRPDLLKEIAYFKEPREGRAITANTLLNFIPFDDANETWIYREDPNKEEGVRIRRALVEKLYYVYEDDNLLASIPFEVASFIPTPEVFERLSKKQLKALEEDYFGIVSPEDEADETRMSSSSRSFGSGEEDRQNGAMHSFCRHAFTPPDFGITMLGSSHGFDSSGSTTGFIVWVYGFGIVVDPPPHCDSYLLSNGVSPRLLNHVILTHCHADHDAGTFQRIIKERKIELMTTKTVYEQFVRKYSAISGLGSQFLKKLVTFTELKVSSPHSVNGAVFEIFHTFHALPCIGFKVTCDGRSISYSGDTYNSPGGLEELVQKEVLTRERKQALLAFPFDADVVLHECGVPPIHTPAETLKALSDKQKENLFAVHISDAAAEAADLRKAKEGFDHTICVKVGQKENSRAINILERCADIYLFSDLNISQTALFLDLCTTRKFKKGTKFVGDLESTFFTVLSGVVKLKRKGKKARYLNLGDYFGELSCMEGSAENLGLLAVSDAEILCIDKYDFDQFLQECPEVKEKLDSLKLSRSLGISDSFMKNSVLRHLSFSQKTAFRMSMNNVQEVEPGYTFFKKKRTTVLDSTKSFREKGAGGVSVIFINSGQIKVKGEGAFEWKLKHGDSASKFGVSSRRHLFSALDKSAKDTFDGFEIGQGALYVPPTVYAATVLSDVEGDSFRVNKSEFKMEAITKVSFNEISLEGFMEFLEDSPRFTLMLLREPSGLIV